VGGKHRVGRLVDYSGATEMKDGDYLGNEVGQIFISESYSLGETNQRTSVVLGDCGCGRTT
jgi:hypothetical protein